MKTINFLIVATIATFSAAQLATASSTTRSYIKDYNYICMHVTKPEALVFKTSVPQKIWKTAIRKTGEIKKEKAIQLGQIQINAQNLKDKSQVATFKADVAAGYQIKGLFEKDTDGELPLTVVSEFLADGINSTIKDHYNCELRQDKSIRLGSAKSAGVTNEN
jgi:hypothetical protein